MVNEKRMDMFQQDLNAPLLSATAKVTELPGRQRDTVSWWWSERQWMAVHRGPVDRGQNDIVPAKVVVNDRSLPGMGVMVLPITDQYPPPSSCSTIGRSSIDRSYASQLDM